MSKASLNALPQPRVRLANLLRKETPRILKIWEERVRSHLDSASTEDVITLRDALPAFLKRVADSIDPSATAESPLASALLHGEQRAEQTQYSLEEVLREYSLLRQVIFEVLEAEIDVSSQWRDLILSHIDNAIRKAATEFIRRQIEGLRTEKARYESLAKEGESREQFIGLLTHDLKSPLTAARLGIELLERRSSIVHMERSIVYRIKENIFRVEKMISDLLDIGQIRAGKPLLLRHEPCDLSEIIRRVLQNLSIVYGNRFQIRGPLSLPGVWAKDALQRSIENLLANAVKYGDSTRPVTVKFGIDEDSSVFVSVHNWGNPIPASELGKLFKPYQRSLGAEQGGEAGWGLGLIQVKATAEAHHGSVSVTSSATQGTEFKLSFMNFAEGASDSL